jgi:hypothetical protein
MRWSRIFGDSPAPGRIAALSLLAALAAGSVEASMMVFLSVEDLARASSRVVRARITGQSTRWTENHEGIVTLVEATVIGDLAGPAGQRLPAGRRLQNVQAGGEVDGILLDWTGRPTFKNGEDLVLFLAPYEPDDPADERLLIVGGKQGRMRVIPGPSGGQPLEVERDLIGVRSAPRISGDIPTEPPPRPDRIPFDELSRRVSAVRGGGR